MKGITISSALRKALLTMSFVAWIALPFVLSNAYHKTANYLGNKTVQIIAACKQKDLDLDNDPWFSITKGLGLFSLRTRSEFQYTVAGLWLLIGVGLFAAAMPDKRKPNEENT